MSSDEHEEVRSLIAPYVLGALSAEERARVRSHLVSCAVCKADAEGFGAVSASLADTITPEPLPDRFAERVLERARGPERVPKPRGRVRPTRRWAWLGHVAAYAALIVAVAVLASNLVATRERAARERRLVEAVLRQQGMALRGEGGAVGRMVPTAEGGLFAATGLASAPAGRTYQLWLIRGGRPASAGTFDTSDGLAVLAVDRTLRGVDAVAVTLEPAGGSPQPTTQPILTSGA